MNILEQSILIKRRFNDFQKFTSREEDISITGFAKKESREWGGDKWDDLCEESKHRVEEAYRSIIEISALKLPLEV